MAAPEPNDGPEVVDGEEARSEETEDFQEPLVGMLEMVAFKKGKAGEQATTWMEEVRSKLEDVGVTELRHFVQFVLVLNGRLANNGHRQLHRTTINLMLREVCDMLVCPDVVSENRTRMSD